MRFFALVVVSSSLFGLACQAVEIVDPAPRSEGSSSSNATVSSGAGAGGGAAGAVVRTVSVRSPWGGPARNLLVDGDFELSISADGHSAANAWYAFDSVKNTERYLRAETGGLCHTGLRCVVLASNMVLFGRGTGAPEGGGLDASVWARVPTGKACDVVLPILLTCEAGDSPLALNPVSPGPDETGWCSYAASLAKAPVARCLYIESKLVGGESAWVDSAVLLARVQPLMDVIAAVPYLEPAQRARQVVRRVRDLTPLGGRTRLPRPPLP